MASKVDPGTGSAIVEQKPRADFSLPKGHALVDQINGVTIGESMKASVMGKVVSGAVGEYDGGARVCLEIEAVEFTPAGKAKGNSMVDDMQSAMHKRRSGGAVYEEAEDEDTEEV